MSVKVDSLYLVSELQILFVHVHSWNASVEIKKSKSENYNNTVEQISCKSLTTPTC